jgi:hypothetical protein
MEKCIIFAQNSNCCQSNNENLPWENREIRHQESYSHFSCFSPLLRKQSDSSHPGFAVGLDPDVGLNQGCNHERLFPGDFWRSTRINLTACDVTELPLWS